VGFELPGHSGEDGAGFAPTSRFCIAVASVAADHQAVQRTSWTTPDTSVGRGDASAAPGEGVKPQQDLAASSRRERRAGALVQARRERGGADAGHRGTGDPGLHATAAAPKPRCPARELLLDPRPDDLVGHPAIVAAGSNRRPANASISITRGWAASKSLRALGRSA